MPKDSEPNFRTQIGMYLFFLVVALTGNVKQVLQGICSKSTNVGIRRVATPPYVIKGLVFTTYHRLTRGLTFHCFVKELCWTPLDCIEACCSCYIIAFNSMWPVCVTHPLVIQSGLAGSGSSQQDGTGRCIRMRELLCGGNHRRWLFRRQKLYWHNRTRLRHLNRKLVLADESAGGSSSLLQREAEFCFLQQRHHSLSQCLAEASG